MNRVWCFGVLVFWCFVFGVWCLVFGKPQAGGERHQCHETRNTKHQTTKHQTLTQAVELPQEQSKRDASGMPALHAISAVSGPA